MPVGPPTPNEHLKAEDFMQPTTSHKVVKIELSHHTNGHYIVDFKVDQFSYELILTTHAKHISLYDV